MEKTIVYTTKDKNFERLIDENILRLNQIKPFGELYDDSIHNRIIYDYTIIKVDRITHRIKSIRKYKSCKNFSEYKITIETQELFDRSINYVSTHFGYKENDTDFFNLELIPRGLVSQAHDTGILITFDIKVIPKTNKEG